jgi:hypothetical protein
MAEMNTAAREHTQPMRRREATPAAHHGLRVEVPNAASGFMLVQRLNYGCALEGSEESGWVIAGPADGDLANTLATIQQWLRDEAIDQVTVHVGDHTHSMTRD